MRPLVKWGAVITTGYVFIRHPSLVNSLLGEVAKILGLSLLLIQFLGWTLILLPVLYVISWVGALLAPLMRLLKLASAK